MKESHSHTEEPAHSHKHTGERTHEHGHTHGHACHSHSHPHEHVHEAGHRHEASLRAGQVVLTVRSFSGLSGDMMLAGMALMAGATQQDLDNLIAQMGLNALAGSISLQPHSLNEIAGWQCRVALPHEHEHRTLTDILGIIEKTGLEQKAKDFAVAAFILLASAEGAVHGKPAQEVCFHEVGALDSILDICLVCALFARIAPAHFRCSPLPLAEGGVHCAHGWLPTPAPATFALLDGVQVCGFAGKGETVTPTAIALLKALGAEFGPWPAMTIKNKALVYGTKVFPNVPNGTLWATGAAL